MRFSTRTALWSIFLALFQFILAPQTASAATSYSSSGTYYAYESFATSGTWSRPNGVTQIDYLIVAGGGRGGGSQYATHFAGGGGGGGGVRSGTISVGQATYAITVGTGQAAGCSQGRGGNSSLAGSDITTVSATGGGSGACNSNYSGVTMLSGYSGGSGGGGGAQVGSVTYGSGNAGGYSPVEGYAGGSSFPHSSDSTYQGGGGGGGASASGANATSACAGKGGNGFSSSITGAAVTYGGGGGGGTRSNSCGGGSGSGGGGSGGLNGAQGTAGTDGLGGGGGGTSLSNGNRGGNGVVIVRYVVTAPATPDLPSASDTGSLDSDNITSNTSFALTGTAVGGSSVQIYDGGSAIGAPCISNISTGLYSCALTGLAAGTHVFTAKASYGGGSENPSVGSLTVTIDTTTPTISGTSSVSVAEGSTSSQSLRASETATINFNGVYDKAQFTLDTSTGLLTFGVHDFESPLDSDLNNQYYVSIYAIDLAGNQSNTYNFFYTVTNVAERAVLGSLTLSSQPQKGVITTLTISSDVVGKFTFFANGKRISGCISKATTGSAPSASGQCSWKPTTTAPVSLHATISSSTGAFLSTNSSSVIVRPGKRTNSR